MRRKLKRVYKDGLLNLGDVRQFDRRECIKKLENMVLWTPDLKNPGEVVTMTMTWIQLQNDVIRISSQVFTSKTQGEDYRLYSYEWKPDLKPNPNDK